MPGLLRENSQKTTKCQWMVLCPTGTFDPRPQGHNEITSEHILPFCLQGAEKRRMHQELAAFREKVTALGLLQVQKNLLQPDLLSTPLGTSALHGLENFPKFAS